MPSLDLIHLELLVGAALVLVGIASSLAATRFGAPLLLVFLAVGMLAGEDGPGGILFDDFRLTYLIGSLALAVILFDGGLRTRLTAFRGTIAPALVLATLGVVVTAGIVAAAAFYGVGSLSPLEALLLGSIVASTDAAAVFFLLRTGGRRLQGRLGPLLEIESGTNDPVAAFLTLVLTELIVADAGAPLGLLLLRLAEHTLVGGALGLAAGFALVALLNRVAMPGGLHPLAAVAFVVATYSLTAFAGGSGLLAVYLAGLVVANRPVRALPSIVGFHDAATWMCQIGMFLVLGLLVTPSTLISHAGAGLLVAMALMFLARPVAVALCLTPFGFTLRETLFVSWVGLRGAVSIFLAAIPVLAGVPDAPLFFNVAFFVVLTSLLVQGWSIAPVARWLGLAQRRTAPNVRRVELDIPGQTELELIGYPVAADSVVLALSRLPAMARLVLVVRAGQTLQPEAAGALRPGDYVYLLAPPWRIARLDQLFEEVPELSKRAAAPFGELPINAEAPVASLAALYGLDVDGEDAAGTVAAYVARCLKTAPRPGMRLPLGSATLVIRAVDGGVVTRAGLQLEELMDTIVATARARRARRGGH